MESGAVPHLPPSAAECWGWVGFHASGQDIHLPLLSLLPALPVCQATGSGAGGVLEQRMSQMEIKSPCLWVMDVKIMEEPQIPVIDELTIRDHKAI